MALLKATANRAMGLTTVHSTAAGIVLLLGLLLLCSRKVRLDRGSTKTAGTVAVVKTGIASSTIITVAGTGSGDWIILSGNRVPFWVERSIWCRRSRYRTAMTMSTAHRCARPRSERVPKASVLWRLDQNRQSLLLAQHRVKDRLENSCLLLLTLLAIVKAGQCIVVGAE